MMLRDMSSKINLENGRSEDCEEETGIAKNVTNIQHVRNKEKHFSEPPKEVQGAMVLRLCLSPCS